MAEKRRGLGRGLGALISSSPVAPPEEDSPPAQDSGRIPEAVSVSRETSGKGTPGSSDAARVNGARARVSSSGNGASAAPQSPASDPSPGSGPAAVEPSVETPRRSSEGQARPAKLDTARKIRPVDMFFTPGRSADGEKGGDDASTAPAPAGSSKKSARPAGKRAAMPDVIGAARARSAASAASAAEDVEQDTGSGAAAATEEGPRSEESPVSRETLVPVPGARFAEVPVDEIHPNRKQPRTVFDEEDMAELVHSIKEIGLLQPIVVRPSSEEGPHKYELVMGERRWRASQEAGLATIPAIVRETQDVDLLRDALLENLHRSQLNPLEEAAAYQQLLQEFECTQDELSDRIGRSRPQISNTIRLMKLPALVQRRVAAGVLSAGHARALLALSDPADMERLAQRIVNEGLSVRATEEIVALSDGLRRPKKEAQPKSAARHERLDFLATALSDRLDTSVKITLGAKKGRVSIEFASVDDLNRIMGVISPGNSN
jgi:ParB family transcriptional regulator, chromosome partitioning protein